MDVRHHVIEERVRLAGIVQRHDVWVCEARRDLDLREESGAPERDGQLGIEHLHRHVASVPQILSELEGFDRGGGALLFLGATNEPWALDPAVLRPGRFDAQIYVGLPDVEAREEIMRLNLAGRPLAAEVDPADLAEELEGLSGADVREICRRASVAAFVRSLGGAAEGQEISASDLRAAAERTPPSVSSDTLRRFGKWRAGGEDGCE